MNLAKLYLNNRLFFYLKGQFYRIDEQQFTAVEEQEFLNAFLPVLVIAREHIKENKKRYPVTDKADLKGILEAEKDEYSVVVISEAEENQTPVKFWHVDSNLVNRFSGKLFLWVPETLIHSRLTEGVLNQITRCQAKIFSINVKQHNYSACSVGPFSSSDYFLMSVGITPSETNEIPETEYASSLFRDITSLSASKLKAVLSAQALPKKLFKLFDWPSMGIGAVLGGALFFGSQFMYLNYKIATIESEIESLDVKRYVQQKQEILDKRKAFEVFANQDVKQPVEFQLWHFLGLIMSEDISVIRIRDIEQGVWLRLEANVATESLSKIRKMEMVSSASLVNAVQNVRGAQRFNIEVKFNGIQARIEEGAQ